MTAPTASGQVEIAAPADVVYDLITDLDAMAAVADETTTMRWRKGSSAAPGAVFTGVNRNGFRRWSTKCTVAEATPATRFTFDVRAAAGILVAGWATGSPDRAGANTTHIANTLRRLKQRAESAAPQRG